MQAPISVDLRVDNNKQVDIRQRFMKLQARMCHDLEQHDDEDHAGTKGDAHELHWLAWLGKYLPGRYHVDQARVIDCDGYVSEQIDLVVYDKQYSPFIFQEQNRTYIPAESVYAVFEVKQALNRANVVYAGEKAASVRRLRRTSAEIYYAGGVHPPKPHTEILAGILTLRSDWSDPLGDPLAEVLQEQDELHRLHLGCALRSGAFRASYAEGFSMSRSTPEEAFVFFFLKLLMALQQAATVPAIDIHAYARALDSI